MQDFRHRSQAVCGATGVRHALVCRSELAIVDAENHGQIGCVLGGCRKHDLAGTGVEVAVVTRLPILLAGRKETGRFQGSLLGSFSAQTRTVFPLTIRLLPSTSTVPGKRPCTLSYLRSMARALGSPKSLMATTSNSLGRAARARNVIRPMRPNPLIPTRTATVWAPLHDRKTRNHLKP